MLLIKDYSSLPETTKVVIAFIQSNTIDVKFKVFKHEEATTSEEANKVRDNLYTLAQGCKALILKTDSDEHKYIQVVLPGDKTFCNAKLRKSLKIKQLRFVSEEELKEITKGVKPGGVPPFGNVYSLPIFLDEQVLENEIIVFNCGARDISVELNTNDYIKIVRPSILDLAN